MDRETLNEMVKLKFAARKACGLEIDLVKLAGDAAYADKAFRQVENLEDESLVILAMTLRDKFGLLSVMPMLPVAASARHEEKKPEVPAATRYMSGARS